MKLSAVSFLLCKRTPNRPECLCVLRDFMPGCHDDGIGKRSTRAQISVSGSQTDKHDILITGVQLVWLQRMQSRVKASYKFGEASSTLEQ